MRGADVTQEAFFTTVHLETFVPKDHPLRAIKVIFDEALTRIDWLLDGAYSKRGQDVDSAGAAVASAVASSFVYDPQRAATHGADPI